MNRYIIDRTLLKENIDKILEKAEVPIIAVVKADGYGFGLEPLVQTLKECGLDRFAVTEIEDLDVLRHTVGEEDDILVMRSTALEEEVEAILKAGCIATIGSTGAYHAAIKVADRYQRPVRCHVKIDTGFSRYGFTSKEISDVLSCYQSSNLKVEGIYTHLSSAFNDEALTIAQVRELCSIAEMVKSAGFDPGMRHAANSPAFFNVEGCELDAVRIGSAFSGRLITREPTGLNRVGYLEARVIDVKELKAGASWGYGGQIKIKRDTLVAFASAGTREGFGILVNKPDTIKKSLSCLKGVFRNRRQTVLIEGQEYPVLAEADLSMTMIDVTGSSVKAGDIVVMDPSPLMVGPHVSRVYV